MKSINPYNNIVLHTYNVSKPNEVTKILDNIHIQLHQWQAISFIDRRHFF